MNKKNLLVAAALVAITLLSGYVGYFLGRQNADLAIRKPKVGPPEKITAEQVMEAISDYLNASEARFNLEECSTFARQGYKFVDVGGKYIGVFDGLKMAGICKK